MLATRVVIQREDDLGHFLRRRAESFKNVIAAIVVMGPALVPPMYAWFTTLGFWVPYSNTGNIKVAVASEDAGYTSDLIPTPINAGEQIIGKLRANDQFAWQFVSTIEAVLCARASITRRSSSRRSSRATS